MACNRSNVPVALSKGNFKDTLGIDAECYVLNDENNTAVINQNGFISALGYQIGGGRLESLIKVLSQTPHPEENQNNNNFSLNLNKNTRNLIIKLKNPLKFMVNVRNSKNENSFIQNPAHGYTGDLLIDVCRELIRLNHENKLHTQQKFLADHANVILSSAAKVGINNLIYALSGCEITRSFIINKWKDYVVDEVTKKYEPIFPEELYNEWYRIYDIEKPSVGRNWKLMHLTMDHIYFNVASSQGKIKELLCIHSENNKETRKRKLHEFLHEIGRNALQETEDYKDSNIKVRISSKIKAKAMTNAHFFGVKISSIIRSVITSLAERKELPINMFQPNKKTLDAIYDLENGKNVHEANTVDDLKRDLGW